MLRNPDFELIKIHNDIYLLPCGQAICDHRLGMRINETGALIWKLAEHAIDKEVLINACIQELEISDNELEQAACDISDFIDSLTDAGVILKADSETGYEHETRASCVNENQAEIDANFDYDDFNPSPGLRLFRAKPIKLLIAGLRINLFCDRSDADPKLSDFRTDDSFTDESSPDQTICVMYSLPPQDPERTYFINGKEMKFSHSDYGYIISYDEYSPVKETWLSEDGKLVTIYAVKAPDLTYHLFHAIRLPFLYMAEKKKKYAIHSASILYKDRAWLFSASAGTGKSTHADLWYIALNTPYINGDLNLIGLENGESFIWGIPWCGTSERYHNLKHRLGGVIFLRRAEYDRVENLSASSGLVSLTRRTISPVWNRSCLKKMITDLMPVTEHIYMCRLYCTKNLSAQQTLQASIDTYLS